MRQYSASSGGGAKCMTSTKSSTVKATPRKSIFSSLETGPNKLRKRWQEKKASLKLETPLNFASTNDIIGGNSGSPVLDRSGRIIGLAFDGNIHSTGGSFGFDPELNRTVSLSSEMIVAALRGVYGANALADELVK